MLGVGCLLKNTSLVKDMKDLVEYIGLEKAGSKKDASLESVYKELRKSGIEIDIQTAGHLYADSLPVHEKGFSSLEDIHEKTGYNYEQTIRNLMLGEPKTGEKQIGDEAPEKAIAERIAGALHSNLVGDATTVSTMRQMQDLVTRGAERLLGKMPNEKKAKTKEDTASIIAKALGGERMGFTDLRGHLNSVKDLFNSVRKELAHGTGVIKTEGDPVLQAQWEQRVKSLEEATYSLLLGKKEANQVLVDAMKKEGFAKEVKGGTVLDWDKMAGQINDVNQLSDHVFDAMKKAGFDPEVSGRVASTLTKEYHELKADILEHATKRFDSMAKSWEELPPKERPELDVSNMVDKRLDEWDNYKKLADDQGKNLVFTKSEAKDIVDHVMKESGFVKERSDGKKMLDWQKLSRDVEDTQKIKSQVVKHFEERGFDKKEVAHIADALDKMYADMHQDIMDHAKAKLDALRKNIERTPAEAKGDLQRLAELHSYGVFNGEYNDVLNRSLGMNDGRQADLATIGRIAKQASDLSRELGGKDYLANYAFQNFQRDINNIVARNITNKSRLLKVVNTISKYFQVVNQGLIGNVYNMLENNLSGAKELMATNINMLMQQGKMNAFKDGKLLIDVWKNIGAGGVEYGEHPGRFTNRENVSDQLNAIKKDKSAKGIARNLAVVALAPSRAWLNGSDGAYKALIHKKTMMMALHQAMIKSGMGREEATQTLHEALYGQSFDQAKVRAASILGRYGLKESPQAVTRLANDLVVGNLNSGGKIGNDVIEAARLSAFHVAGLGMGHEANNFFSRKLQAGKAESAQRENQYIKDGNWNALAKERMYGTIYYNGIMRFMGGAINWGRLRLEASGLGIATGLFGNYKGNIDFSSKENLQATMQSYMKARSEIARGMVGLGYTAMVGAGLYGIAKAANPDSDSPMGDLLNDVKDSYPLNRIMMKVAPDMVLMEYIHATSKSGSSQEAAFKYIQNVFNIGDSHSIGGQIAQIEADARNPSVKSQDKATGEAYQILGGMVEVPLWRSYKGAYQLLKWGVTGQPIENTYIHPYTAMEGLLAGGMLQDLDNAAGTGIFQKYAPVESLPGVGDKVVAQLNALGIKNVSDLKDHPGWENYIPNVKSRQAAVDAYNQVHRSPKEKITKNASAGGGAESNW